MTPTTPTPSRGFLRDWTTFYRGFRKDYFHTGSVVPSSRYLSRELAANLRGDRAPARILELGPGTGPVTAEILKTLQPGDLFDAVEINGDFVQALCQRFNVSGPSPLESEPGRFRIFHAPVQHLPGDGCYHHLVSGLPFNNFPIRLVREIWKNIHRLAAPGATFAFFEYIAIRKMKQPFVGAGDKKRLALIGRYLRSEIEQHQFRARKIWVNVPPAVVHHLRLS